VSDTEGRLIKNCHDDAYSLYGMPMGGEIKYADQQTLRESLSHRVET